MLTRVTVWEAVEGAGGVGVGAMAGGVGWGVGAGAGADGAGAASEAGGAGAAVGCAGGAGSGVDATSCVEAQPASRAKVRDAAKGSRLKNPQKGRAMVCILQNPIPLSGAIRKSHSCGGSKIPAPGEVGTPQTAEGCGMSGYLQRVLQSRQPLRYWNRSRIGLRRRTVSAGHRERSVTMAESKARCSGQSGVSGRRGMVCLIS